jgi:hypothetical protein
MKNKKKLWFGVILITVLFLIVNVSGLIGADNGEKLLKNFKIVKPAESLLPSDIAIKPGFAEGAGKPIGTIQKIRGEAYVIHKNDKAAFRLKNNFPLFTEDTMITSDESSIDAVMNDRSLVTLASYSKITLTESVYDPKKETRSSLINVLFGQVRFIVVKITGSPNFRVKTPTAVCGVRGTDFCISVIPASVETSGLEIVSKAYAFEPASLITTVITGTGSTVEFAGVIGPTTIVGPTSVASAGAGAAATGASFVGSVAAGSVMNAVGPGLATMRMPPGFE